MAGELRARHPELLIDWLAQPPVTGVLEERGERVHPASRALASESSHIESEAGEHDLHVFQALRRMDEVLVANFMVFHDLVRDEPYDLWVADEGWDIDYFLHENPELKRAASSFSSVRALRLPTSPGARSRPARVTPNAPASRNSTRELLVPSAGDPGRTGYLIVGAGLSS